MATIKPIAGGSVHQIQSGQVIVDLVSVVKELVENSLDAGATSIDLRFKSNGLESIEVQDNGPGISKEDYETVALKHTTSKLSSYDDLSSLKTFGFRGEALSSLCALSSFHIVTAREDEAPKGTRLDFEVSGRLKSTQVVAAPKGTTVAVETLFKNLPVRRQQLEVNIKREYGKALGVLQAYACISTNVKLSVSNVMAKGKKAIVFSTKSNPTTRENIANVYGSKTIPALVALDLDFEMKPSGGVAQSWNSQNEGGGKQVQILGFVSRPVFGEGRQTPDRQMFFVNSRPCGLPQVAKVFNEVYKSYNLTQSPFIFANLIIDTNAYDVNVSPDKRKILLHDQGALLESIKKSLTELFDKQQQTVPQSQQPLQRSSLFKPLTVSRVNPATTVLGTQSNETGAYPPVASFSEDSTAAETHGSTGGVDGYTDGDSRNLIHDFLGRKVQERIPKASSKLPKETDAGTLSFEKQRLIKKLAKEKNAQGHIHDYEDTQDLSASDALFGEVAIPVVDFNQRIAEQQVCSRNIEDPNSPSKPKSDEDILSTNNTPAKSDSGVVQNAFDRMRSKRTPLQTATITIGSKTITSMIGSPSTKRRRVHEMRSRRPTDGPQAGARSQKFPSSLRAFAAPGTQATDSISDDSDEQADITWDSEANDVKSPSTQWSNDLRLAVSNHNHGKDFSNDEVIRDEGSDDISLPVSGAEDSDGEYLDEEGKKKKEDAKVAQLIQEAEERSAQPSQDNIKRAHQLLKGGSRKDSTTDLIQTIDASLEKIDRQLRILGESLEELLPQGSGGLQGEDYDADSAEERLALTVSKEDFARMRIIGQFNLGFIIAARPAQSLSSRPPLAELFIIDQHASDEKYNFERLQASTIVQNQRLVHPQDLDLTAIEEEIILENQNILLKNGFLLDIDESGDAPVGQRCKLVSLPMSREVTFTTRDLEELLALLAESPPASTTTTSNNASSSADTNVPRPSKVRKMFAMRACRSSVMIGKTLTSKQMERLVRHMGEIDKPWNCPHGRPTMRHLVGLGSWQAWREGDGIVGSGDGDEGGGGDGNGNGHGHGDGDGEVDWGGWIQARKGDPGGLSRHADVNTDVDADPEDSVPEEEEETDDSEANGKYEDEDEDEVGLAPE